jgi:4-hydroxybenzoate polyprenyltransferase
MNRTTPAPAVSAAALLRLIRFGAYGPLFMATALFGALISFAQPDAGLVMLELFVAASAAFGFVINDISDRDLDAQEPDPRNPLADGTCPLWAAYAIAAALLVISGICLLCLPLPLILPGALELFIFATYSFCIEVKNIAGLDLMYHGMFPALYGAMGYLLYRAPDSTGAVFVLIVFVFGAVAEIFNEIRDYTKDRAVRRNFVVIAGKQQAFAATLAAMTVAIAGTATVAIMQPQFYWLLLFVPFSLFLVHPVWKAMWDARYESTFVGTVNIRAILLASSMIAGFALARYYGFALP